MKLISIIASAVLVCSQTLQAQTAKQLQHGRIQLPNGWKLSPVGRSLPLGDLPLNIAVSSSKKLLAVTNNGQSTQSIQLIDAASEKILDNVVIAKSWYGLAFSNNDEYLYASGGHDNWILQYHIISNKLQLIDSIKLGKKWPEKISPTGIAIDDAKHLLYVVTKENNSLYIIDLATKKQVGQLALGAEAYACLLSKDKQTLFISLWGGDKLLYYDLATRKIVQTIEVGSHPNEICFDKSGKYLFVANSNDNSVSVVNIASHKVIETLNAALYPNAPSGSTTNGLAISENGKTLYIANADNNCLAVFDINEIGNSKSKGFIPVGWYPTNVKVVGKKIFVSNGKGFTSKANPNGPNPINKKQAVNYQQSDNSQPAKVQYIAGLFTGTMSIINEPSEKQLAIFSKAVYINTPYTKEKETNAEGMEGNPIPMQPGKPSPIKYVFYIIKENRTYDQVLGDIKEGNGDTSLVLFGENITPNQHALAKEFVLLDNFYVDAEVSADGHNWSMGAYATDYLEKTWPSSYGGRGGSFDGEGIRAIANNKNGFIWDLCQRSNVTYRTYGVFATKENPPRINSLKGHICPSFTGWDMGTRDTTRFTQWKKDFDMLLANNALPQVSTLRFGNDHTEGIKAGRPTPFAHVADNDLAMGLFIDYLSHSSIWKESAVFILEDDAQNGPDHVDAHRSTAYVISPFIKRHSVDHTMYSTSSMLRTIELIAGMPPMTQYDAAATPMWRAFTANADNSAYTCLPININLNDKNVANTPAAKKSAAFNFSKEDGVPDSVFNDVLWLGIKGIAAPAPLRAAFVKLAKKKKDDDD
ncbi:MAG: bifunctional YncE family protein/alkaline phosphatase family protein [Chitinophagaceae bacterium]|nr:bifunctional YncE family protein/alkaline phosphatase family protein [Chitinophagaceae bacterium]